MLKKQVLLALILVYSASLLAQERGRPSRPGNNPQAGPFVAGKVMDENDAPIPYASVSLHAAADSILISGVATNNEGRFFIKCESADYFIKVRFLSYKELVSPTFSVTDTGKRLGRIFLEPNAEVLDEVKVIGELGQAEFKLDKRVYNVQKDLNNVGGNAADILDNVPSVAVDVEGNVSLRGNQNVRILVDGKQSGLIGISSADALRQLQSNLIEKVEVITNPGAKFDAEGEVGIINIVLKKEREKGFNASIDLFTGVPDDHGAAFNLNFRRQKVNFFGSAGFRYRERPGNGHIYQEFTLPDTTYSFDNTRNHNRRGLSGNLRLGIDYMPSRRSTITFSGMISESDGNNTLDMVYQDFDANGFLVEDSDRNEVEKERTGNREVDVNYRYTFPGNKDRLFTFDVKRQMRIDLEEARISQTFTSDASAILLQRSDNKENEANWVIQTDYAHPIGKNGILETGMKASIRDIENDYRVEQLDTIWNLVPGFFNELKYDEDIFAAYVTWGDEIGKFSYKAGLRAEQTNIKTELRLTNESNPREYLNLFPSVHTSYDYSETNAVQASYSKRINRPRFWSLVPFYGFGDQRNFYSGNPNLNPEYIDSFEFGHLSQSEKGSLLFSIYSRFKEGVNQRIVSVDSLGTFTRPVNLGTAQAFGAEASLTRSIATYWRLNTNINFFRERIDGSFEGRDYSADTYAWNGRMSSKWTIKKEVDVQATFRYRSPRQAPQGEYKSTYSLDMGVSKDVLKGKGTLTFNARDLFNTRKRRGIVIDDNYYSENEFQWRSRVFRLTFNYRINQKKRRQRPDWEAEGPG